MAFGRSPESWLQLLPQYDLWQDEQRSDTIKVKHFATPAPCCLGIAPARLVGGQAQAGVFSGSCHQMIVVKLLRASQ